MVNFDDLEQLLMYLRVIAQAPDIVTEDIIERATGIMRREFNSTMALCSARQTSGLEQLRLITDIDYFIDLVAEIYGDGLRRIDERARVEAPEFAENAFRRFEAGMEFEDQFFRWYEALGQFFPSYGDPSNPTADNTALPTVNGTDCERKAFRAAIDAGLLTIENGRYSWKESKSLLAYFLFKLYANIPYGDLQKIGLEIDRRRISDARREETYPRGSDTIDRIFESQD